MLRKAQHTNTNKQKQAIKQINSEPTVVCYKRGVSVVLFFIVFRSVCVLCCFVHCVCITKCLCVVVSPPSMCLPVVKVGRWASWQHGCWQRKMTTWIHVKDIRKVAS